MSPACTLYTHVFSAAFGHGNLHNDPISMFEDFEDSSCSPDSLAVLKKYNHKGPFSQEDIQGMSNFTKRLCDTVVFNIERDVPREKRKRIVSGIIQVMMASICFLQAMQEPWAPDGMATHNYDGEPAFDDPHSVSGPQTQICTCLMWNVDAPASILVLCSPVGVATPV